MTAHPLENTRILDFTRYQQGPFATMMLADLGAEVIKVEEPGSGDFSRRMWREPDGFSAFWEGLNRGKRSIEIDLRSERARDLVLQMADGCDVVVENFRVGVMEGWGLGYDVLRQRNPRIIYGQATGWGSNGPMAGLQSFDQVAQAFSGFAQHAGGGPGARPEVPFFGLADQVSAINLALGIMTALYVRERTGVGQRIEVSLLGSQMALQGPEILHLLHAGEEHVREFRASATIGHYECGDGRWLMIVVLDQKFWSRLTSALHLEEITEDPRFSRGFPRYVNRRDLETILERAFASQPSQYWLERLEARGVPASVVLDYGELVEHEQPWANGYLAYQDHPRFGRQRVVGLPISLSETPARVSDPAPDPGQHTDAVLRGFGFSDEAIAELRSEGVIGTQRE